MKDLVMSMAEIVRVGVWSLRALGLPFGTAERAVRLLAFSEAVQGGAVRMLRTAESAIQVASALPQPSRVRDPSGGWSIAAHGKHLLEIGGPVVDLVTADARRLGHGHVRLEGAIGAWLLPALCDVIVERRLAVVAVYASGAGETPFPGHGHAGWIAGIRAGTEARFMAADLGSGEADLRSVLDRSPLATSDPVEAHLAADWAAASDRATGGSGFIGLSAWDAAPAVRPWPAALPVVDYAARLAKAYREGVIVERLDCDHLYALERRTWAPTSDRSRNQAGFGKYGDAKS